MKKPANLTVVKAELSRRADDIPQNVSRDKEPGTQSGALVIREQFFTER
jgi:hypothetical protein